MHTPIVQLKRTDLDLKAGGHIEIQTICRIGAYPRYCILKLYMSFSHFILR